VEGANAFRIQAPPTLRDRAAECERQAAEIKSPEVREALLQVASRWPKLAEEDEARERVRRRSDA
jgi:hypothetical protein